MINKRISILTNKQIDYLSYIISFVPAALIIGAFVVDLIVSFCAIVFFYISFKEKFKFYYNHWIVKLLIIFCFYLSLKSILNNEESHSIIRSFFYLRYVLFSLLICYIYNINPKFKKIFLKFTTLTLAILSIHAYLIHFFNFDLLIMNFDELSIEQNFSSILTQWKTPLDYRISGLFYSESIMGSYIEKILPIYLGLVFLNNKSKKYYVYSILFFFLIVISGERAALALSLLFFLIFIFVYNANLKEKFLLISIFFITFLFIFSNPNLKTRIVDNTIKNITERKVSTDLTANNEKNKKININFFSLGHQGHFISAYKIFKDNPIFGVGIKNFRFECKKPEYKDTYSCTTHPHNSYLQLLAETGIVGFCFIFIIFIFLSFQILKIVFVKKIKVNTPEHYKCFLLSVFINLWPIIPTGSFFNNWTSICYFLSIGFFLGEMYKRENVI